MLGEIRALANDAAQTAFSAACVQMIARGGDWRKVDADVRIAYATAERIIDTLDEYERAVQAIDTEAPDYFDRFVSGLALASGGYVSESELRLLDGNR